MSILYILKLRNYKKYQNNKMFKNQKVTESQNCHDTLKHLNIQSMKHQKKRTEWVFVLSDFLYLISLN